jgi:hypothetical protein
VHPPRCKAIATARRKTRTGAAILAQLLRADLLPKAWIAPAKVRQLRALHPVRKRPQAGQLGRADPDRARLGPESPARAHPGQGSAWLRWLLNQAAQTAKRSPEFAATNTAIAKRCGKKIITIAIVRKLLTRAWHLLADMQATDTTTSLRRP